MKSLNQIIAELEAFANVHYQIHTFGHGDVWEIDPNSSSIVYPVLWFVPNGGTTGLREVTTNFTVLCMDLVDSGEENETEVLSDTLQIILDVCAYYRQQHDQDYIVEFGSTITPFTERDPQSVSGHSITISIRQPHTYNECAIPFSGAPTPIVPTCLGGTIQNAASNPTYQASVESGGSFVLPQIKVLDSNGVTEILADYIPESDGYAVECSTICPDGTVENSDQTVSVTVGSGDTETFPDTPISANSDLIVNQPSGAAVDIPVEYETQGTVPTTITGGKIIVPDSPIDPNKRVFVMNQVNNIALFIDDYGNFITDAFGNQQALDVAENGVVEIGFEGGFALIDSGGCHIGFSMINGYGSANFTGFLINTITDLRFIENGTNMGTIDNIFTQGGVEYSVVRGADGLFRGYRDGTLIYTSAYSNSGTIYPTLLSAGAKKPITRVYVKS